MRPGSDAYRIQGNGGALNHESGPNTNEKPSIKLSGNLTIGGLFSVHAGLDRGKCGMVNEEVGIHRLEAMLYAVDMVSF